MNYPIFTNSVNSIQLTDRKQFICTTNAFSHVLTTKDGEFLEALQNADIVVPDGFPVVWALKILYRKKVKKIAGEDLFFFIMKMMQQQKGKVFFLGSTNESLQKMKQRTNNDYPNITVFTYSPPYKPTFNEEDNAKIFSEINAVNPDIVFVGMTAPKQEKWAYRNKEQLETKAIVCVGAVFDFYAGTVKRAPKLLIKLHLEWFYRLIREPRRMWKRYLIYSPLFFWDLFLYFLGIKKKHFL